MPSSCMRSAGQCDCCMLSLIIPRKCNKQVVLQHKVYVIDRAIFSVIVAAGPGRSVFVRS